MHEGNINYLLLFFSSRLQILKFIAKTGPPLFNFISFHCNNASLTNTNAWGLLFVCLFCCVWRCVVRFVFQGAYVGSLAGNLLILLVTLFRIRFNVRVIKHLGFLFQGIIEGNCFFKFGGVESNHIFSYLQVIVWLKGVCWNC